MIDPVAFPSGSTEIVYAPVVGSVRVSRKPPDVPAYVVAIELPFGCSSEICTADIVTPDSARLMRSPAVPAKRSWAFSPGEVVVTVTGEPPALIGYACVALPVMLRVLELPPAVAVTEKVTEPRLVGVNVPV